MAAGLVSTDIEFISVIKIKTLIQKVLVCKLLKQMYMAYIYERAR